MKYYIIAGEASGDLHGSNLIKALKQVDQAATFRFWGGDLMQKAANEEQALAKHYKELAFMGFVEVLFHLPKIWSNIQFCKADILDYQPDSIILIDYAGFNLRIAKFAKKAGFKVFYYISPKVWVWNEGRVKKLKKYVDKMFVIFPFEKDFYQKKWQWPSVEFVGNPLVDAIANYKKANPLPSKLDLKGTLAIDERPIIALLAGSRRQEVRRMLPLMAQMSNYFLEYQFVIAGAPALSMDFYRQILEQNEASQVAIVQDQTYLLLSLSSAALVTSGTATLETALFNVPQVVCYKSDFLSYLIAKQLIQKRIKFISLVNLILQKEAVKELIQGEMNSTNLRMQLSVILKGKVRKEVSLDYVCLKKMLGNEGASQRTAQSIIEYLKINS